MGLDGGGIVRLLDFSKIIFMRKTKSRSASRTVYELRRIVKLEGGASITSISSTLCIIDFVEYYLMIRSICLVEL